MPGKTTKKQSKRPASLTAATKLRQKRAREKRALKRIGQAAQKRLARRAFLKTKRAEDPNFGRPTEPTFHTRHEALNTNDRGHNQLIYSVRGWWER